jgi:hypothetical protein
MENGEKEKHLLIENLDKDEDIIYLRFEPWLYSNTEQCFLKIYQKEKLRQLAKFFSDYAEIFETSQSQLVWLSLDLLLENYQVKKH